MGKDKKDKAAAGEKVLVRNKKATHDFAISEKFEAGISLVGSEVKSLREQNVNITDAYVEIRGGEAWLINAQIQPYPWANQFNHEPRRKRKLLLHRAEIKKLDIKTSQRGFSMVPLSMYMKNGKVKVEFGLGKGKREFEKRSSKKDQEAKREIARAMKEH